ncbi:hypothetical protein [Streptomyces kanamyceticus]|uniref:hypothetical protein n=1 Tax=Streptomyces kanamyceticus TaxID=1967 RepID=UPI0037DCE190
MPSALTDPSGLSPDDPDNERVDNVGEALGIFMADDRVVLAGADVCEARFLVGLLVQEAVQGYRVVGGHGQPAFRTGARCAASYA